MSGGPELHSRTRCETLAHRIDKMPTRDRLCEHCFPALKMPSRETEQWQLFSTRLLGWRQARYGYIRKEFSDPPNFLEGGVREDIPSKLLVALAVFLD